MPCLDATILIDILRRVPAARAKIEELERGGPLLTTEIGAYELYLGIERFGARRRDEEARKVADLLAQVDALPFDRASTIRTAQLSWDLKRRGQTIGLLDLLTAGIALGHGHDTIVTRDQEDFRRVPRIRVETY